jgi:nitrite reductase/ring-hydroxylating ferredoxin subunit
MAQQATSDVLPERWSDSAPTYRSVVAGDDREPPEFLAGQPIPGGLPSRVDRDRYRSPSFMAAERDAIWGHVWQMACRVEQLPQHGDCVVYEGPRASLLLVHGEDGTIRAFENSCRHRGMRLCAHDTSVARISCPFHGFTWNLDGSLAHVPSRWDFADLDENATQLLQVRAECWGGFVFVNHDPDAPSLEAYLGRMTGDFAQWPREKIRARTIMRKTIHANWKTCMDGFVEAYHVPGIHAQAMPFGGDSSVQYDVIAGAPHVSRFIQPFGVQSDKLAARLSQQEVLEAAMKLVVGGGDPVPDCPRLPEGAPARAFFVGMLRSTLPGVEAMSDTELVDAIQYSLFPNLIVFRSAQYPYAYRFLPDRHRPDRTTFDFYVFEPVPDDGAPSDAWFETQLVELGEDDLYADAGVLPPWLGQIYDQDASGLAECQAGIENGGDGALIFADYQEVRIRQQPALIDRYIAAATAAQGSMD